MHQNYRWLFLLSLILFVVSCDVNVSSANRSGTIDNDYIDEPLSKNSKKYSVILETSNQIIELIRAKEYKKIYNSHVDDSMKSVITKEFLEKAYSDATNAMGSIIEYKELQWGFLPTSDNNHDYIVSYKIIIHEKGRLDYSFAFIKSGDHKKIMGLSIKPRNKARLPNET